MKYCNKCGSELNNNVNFCQHCGEKVENNDFVEENNNSNFFNIDNLSKNLSSVSQYNVKNNNKSSIYIRYFLGGLFVFIGFFDLPHLAGFFDMFLGISLMPIFYRLLKDKKNIDFKGIQIIIPVLLIFVSGLFNGVFTNNDSSSNGNIENNGEIINSNNDNKNDSGVDNTIINDKNTESLEEKWSNYYKDNNIEVIDVDSDTLYTYGAYYKDKTILTGIEIDSISTKTIKANIENDSSLFYSFVLNFEDNNEIKKYKEGDKIVVIGEVSPSSLKISKTITLNKCHVVASKDLAQTKINELTNNKSQYIEYAKNLEQIEKQSEINKELSKKNDYISKCEYKNYQDILRNPGSYKKQYIKVYGNVIQISNGWFGSVTIRLKDSSGNIWYVSYSYSDDNEARILEGDNISVYGESTGTTSYTTILGSQVTIPSIDAKYIDIG